MLLPDTVGTGGDSHTRFPIGISFPAGSGLVAFAAATGVMPLDMPESVLVKFKGKMQPGITLRDLVHAIPYYAIQAGDLTVEKKGKKNIFSGRILEIDLTEMETDLTVEQAFELSDAEYTKVYEIDLADIKEPVLCCPNDPDDAKLLSDVQGVKIDEVFVGSCMTNIGHFRAAGKLLDKVPGGSLSTRLWLAPPTRMDEHQLMEEGFYNIYGKAGARTEMPGCSLCMGNQARVAPNTTCVSTSTRNFPNRLGQGANVYLASAELASVAAVLGKLPSPEEYQQYAAQIDSMSADIYQYLNFDKMGEYTDAAKDIDTKKIAAAQLS
jgi:aconitase B